MAMTTWGDYGDTLLMTVVPGSGTLCAPLALSHNSARYGLYFDHLPNNNDATHKTSPHRDKAEAYLWPKLSEVPCGGPRQLVIGPPGCASMHSTFFVIRNLTVIMLCGRGWACPTSVLRCSVCS
jgi:hypothetical protein